MFENLSDRFNTVFRNLAGRGRITEDNVREAMREVRTALLEADVHLDVVKQFTDDVTNEATGREVTKSLKPGEEMVGIVHQKLVDLMGPVDSHLMMVDPGPTIVMMCGLQGSGTTGEAAAKHGRSYVLIDENEQAVKIMQQRLAQYQHQHQHQHTHFAPDH